MGSQATHYFAAGAVILCSVGAFAQRGTTPPTPPSPQEQRIADRASSGDLAAIEEARRSGNSWYVPFLLGYVESEVDRSRYPSPATTAAKAAVTLLISTDQMQAMFCDAVRGDSVMPVARELRIVGGWFGIRTLQMLLTSEAHQRWQRALGALPGKLDDISYLPPKFLALNDLQEIVPNPPSRVNLGGASTEDVEAAAKAWLQWIPTHAQELAPLKPTGEGVVFSEKGCR